MKEMSKRLEQDSSSLSKEAVHSLTVLNGIC